jgi:periplasmic protein TonB
MAASPPVPAAHSYPAFRTLAGRSAPRFGLSLAIHALALAALVLVPLYVPDVPRIAAVGPPVLVFLPDPPPPPPLPLPLGSGTPERAHRQPRPPVEPPAVPTAMPADAPVVVQPQPTPSPLEPESPTAGVPTGSEAGVPEGMDGGVPDGDAGGLPDGVRGGTVGGTGTTVPVGFSGYDQPPRGLTFVRPRYPHDAFDQKVQGTVVVEFVIDVDGRVADPRVVRSVPLLDAAALEAVRQWRFQPALKKGRPVATRSRAPVSFRIL